VSLYIASPQSVTQALFLKKKLLEQDWHVELFVHVAHSLGQSMHLLPCVSSANL